jgi:hypothetical protein
MKQSGVVRKVLCAAMLAFVSGCAAGDRQTPQAETQEARPPLSEKHQRLLAMLPEDNALEGWTRSPDVQFYGPTDLWEFIDGGAEAYLACGYEEVVSAEYSNPNMRSEVLVDVYRMSGPRSSGCIYQKELDPSYELRAIGEEGYVSGTMIGFRTGPFYVKLTTFEQSYEVQREMIGLAEAVSRSVVAAANQERPGGVESGLE